MQDVPQGNQTASDVERFQRLSDAHDWEPARETARRLVAVATDAAVAQYRWSSFATSRMMHQREVAKTELCAAIEEIDALLSRGVTFEDRWWSACLLDLDRLGEVELALDFAGRFPASAADTPSYRVALERMNVAIEMRRARSFEARPIVPIGHNCLCDDFARRWGFHSLTVESPFSAAQYFGNGPAVALRTNFSLFSDAANTRIYTAPAGLQCAVVPDYQAVYNHESGPYWTGDGLRNFFTLYRRRIENIRRVFSGAEPLLVFVQDSPIELSELVEGIETIAQDRPWRLLLLDLFDSVPNNIVLDSRIRVVKLALPTANYAVSWHLPTIYNSAEAYAFERQVVDVILDEARLPA